MSRAHFNAVKESHSHGRRGRVPKPFTHGDVRAARAAAGAERILDAPRRTARFHGNTVAGGLQASDELQRSGYRSEKFTHRGVERCGVLQIRQMAYLRDSGECGARDDRRHPLHFCGRRQRVFFTNDDKGRYTNAAQQ